MQNTISEERNLKEYKMLLLKVVGTHYTDIINESAYGDG